MEQARYSRVQPTDDILVITKEYHMVSPPQIFPESCIDLLELDAPCRVACEVRDIELAICRPTPCVRWHPYMEGRDGIRRRIPFQELLNVCHQRRSLVTGRGICRREKEELNLLAKSNRRRMKV